MKLDITLNKDNDGNIEFSMDYDKELSGTIEKGLEGLGKVIDGIIKSYFTMRSPTATTTMDYIEKLKNLKKSKKKENDNKAKDSDETTEAPLTGTDADAPSLNGIINNTPDKS